LTILDFLIGRPLSSSEERAEQIGVTKGIPIFGLDALSSAAYGPEAALTLLIPLGVAGLSYILPISISIVILLVIVFFSYRQTIAAYPQGGGSYTVARANLGTFSGLLAAAALLIDYVLTAAVGISAGIGALTSAVPSLHARTLSLCLGALVILTIVNLRGLREAGVVFLAPTYLFLVCLLAALAIGVVKSIASGGHPMPLIQPPSPNGAHGAIAAASVWLLLRSFASGCTALTGVEAVSNGVMAFRDDRVKNAQRTLGIIIAALGLMLAGIAYLAKAYRIVATDPNGNNYQSVLSMILEAVSGRGWFYGVAITSILLVLIFSANTAFADFPRVCKFIADDGYLPLSFANRGRRLVYSEGIIILAIITGVLLTIFGGITDRLIPLYAVGAFLAFTMSQAGMVAHWRREKGRGAGRNIFVNALGATVTGITVVVVIVAKFTEGAWITVLMIPSILALMYAVHRHYRKVQEEIASTTPLETQDVLEPIVVITMIGWNKVMKRALLFAMTLSHDLKVLHVVEEDAHDDFHDHWTEYVETPAKQANLPVPELVEVESPYRFVINPIVDYVRKLAKDNPDRRIIAVVPELMELRWYYYFLHSQRATLLKTRLLVAGNDRISVLNIPWYMKSK